MHDHDTKLAHIFERKYGASKKSPVCRDLKPQAP